MRSDLQALFAAGRIGDCRKALAASPARTVADKLVECIVEVASGNDAKAYSLATALSSNESDAGVLVDSLTVAGRIDYAKGRWIDGANRFTRARAAAIAAQDKGLVARSIAGHTEALLHFVTLEGALGNLRPLRQAAVAAGTPEGLFEYHLIVAEMESRLGRANRAERELALAATFLQAAPNLVREARWQLARSSVSAARGDWRGTFSAADGAYRVASTAGALVLAELALNNLAHSQVVVGRLQDARESTARLAASTRRSGQVLLTRSSIELSLAVAEGDLERARAIDESASKLADEFQGGQNSYGHWYRVAQLNYLVQSGRPDSAVAQAESTIRQLEDSRDRVLVDRVRSAAASAFAVLGDSRRTLDLVTKVAEGPLGQIPEIVAVTEGSLGRIAGLDGDEALEHLWRCRSIYEQIGHESGRLLAQSEANRFSATLDSARSGQPADVPHSADEPVAKAGAGAIRGAAALVSLASDPALVGKEVLRIIERLALGHARLDVGSEAPRGDGLPRVGPAHGSGNTVEIPLSGEGHRVVVAPSNDTSARITLLALQRLVASARELHAARLAESERSALWPDPLPEQQLGFVCASEVMLDLMRTTRRVAASPITVLITGETGTGKELLARAVHQCSQRAAARFIPFNCTAVARDMLESQLFGYRKGAFTGAQEAFPGIIRGAAGGTLFLDEIGEIGLDVQPKLLRFLESSEVHPLGESAPVPVDVRVVAATNADLDRLMTEGKFREDLFYRLNVVKLTIPPLRERREEIPLLLDHFLERTQKEAGKTGLRIAESTAEFLLLYAWPGNVRELANEVRRVVALAESGSVIMPEHLSPKIAATRRTVPVAERPLEPTELVVRRDQPLSAAVEHVERALIQDALRSTTNVEAAARRLGLSRKGLYLKRQRLKIDD